MVGIAPQLRMSRLGVTHTGRLGVTHTGTVSFTGASNLPSATINTLSVRV